MHILGADIGRAIQIRVNNPLDLAKAQGGTAGAIAAFVVPKTVENKVLTTMVDQFKTNLTAAGVVADVQIVADSNARPVTGSKDLATGAIVGVALSAAGWSAWHFGIRKLIFRGA